MEGREGVRGRKLWRGGGTEKEEREGYTVGADDGSCLARGKRKLNKKVERLQDKIIKEKI